MYSIGQIIYVLLSREKSIVPMQVVEEISRKTKNGLEVSYVAAFGSGENKETIIVTDIKGEIFSSLDEIKHSLLQRATASIDALLVSASKKADSWYPQHLPEPEVPQQVSVPVEEQEPQMVRLPDGTLARVRLPDLQ
jgi:hypothetical protein